MSKIKYMDIEEFRELGYLQEVNRFFFHPLGLALEITIDDEGKYVLSGVWDSRDDPEGFIFADLSLPESIEKAEFIHEETQKRKASRVKALDYWIQPVPSKVTGISAEQ